METRQCRGREKQKRKQSSSSSCACCHLGLHCQHLGKCPGWFFEKCGLQMSAHPKDWWAGGQRPPPHQSSLCHRQWCSWLSPAPVGGTQRQKEHKEWESSPQRYQQMFSFPENICLWAVSPGCQHRLSVSASPLLTAWLMLQLIFLIRCTSLSQGTPELLQPWKAGAQPAALGNDGIQTLQKKLPERETSSKGLGREDVLYWQHFTAAPGCTGLWDLLKCAGFPNSPRSQIPDHRWSTCPLAQIWGDLSRVPQQPSRLSGSWSSPWLSQRRGWRSPGKKGGLKGSEKQNKMPTANSELLKQLQASDAPLFPPSVMSVLKHSKSYLKCR